MAGMMSKVSGLTRILSVVAVLAVLVALVLVLLPGQQKKYVTASFPRTVSLYQGSDVRILGVPVGKVESVTPTGTDVTVKMSYDAKYKVPADAKAVIISPAIVGDRFIQLAPVYNGGKVMADNATLTTKSTGMPLELDQIYQSIDDLTVALGPRGANKQGALTNLLDSTAKNFAGQGDQFHETIKNLSKLTSTLDDNKSELFGTARQIERFVSALAKNDKTVRRFNGSLASAADLLSDERSDLAAALKNLGVATQQVSSFVRENRDSLSKNIKGLNVVSKVLVKQRAALAETLKVAPLTLSNLFHTYNPVTGTLDTRANVGEFLNQLTSDPGTFLCGILNQADAGGTSCKLVKQALKGLPKLPTVPGLPRTSPLGEGRTPARAVQVEHIDKSLAGLVQVKR
jgi:phospholipid/cholesterol/gamma-HCH transport system substrate-binding protein